MITLAVVVRRWRSSSGADERRPAQASVRADALTPPSDTGRSALTMMALRNTNRDK